ncbi:MAG: hypothetical protein ACTS8U_03255 [Arsenophonus sp. ET-DL9-MAG3]
MLSSCIKIQGTYFIFVNISRTPINALINANMYLVRCVHFV